MLVQSKEKIVQAIEEHISRNKVSQEKLAKQMKISAPTLSNIRNGVWEHIADKMWNAIAAYLCMTEFNILMTGNMTNIQKCCQTARELGRMELVIGPAGAGKTTALKHYRQMFPDTYYVLCQDSMSKKDLLVAIATEMGANSVGGLYAIQQSIADVMREKGNSLLILDDSGKLTDRKLHIVQQIYDNADGRAGIVLAGVNYTYDNLQKGMRKGKMGYPELVSRIAQTVSLSNRPDKFEIEQIAVKNGINVPHYLDWLKGNVGDFRQLANYIKTLLRQGADVPANELTSLLKSV